MRPSPAAPSVPYAVIWANEAPGLGRSSRRLLIRLAGLADRRRRVAVALKHLAETLDISRDTVRRTLRSLAERRLLKLRERVSPTGASLPVEVELMVGACPKPAIRRKSLSASSDVNLVFLAGGKSDDDVARRSAPAEVSQSIQSIEENTFSAGSASRAEKNPSLRVYEYTPPYPQSHCREAVCVATLKRGPRGANRSLPPDQATELAFRPGADAFEALLARFEAREPGQNRKAAQRRWRTMHPVYARIAVTSANAFLALPKPWRRGLSLYLANHAWEAIAYARKRPPTRAQVFVARYRLDAAGDAHETAAWKAWAEHKALRGQRIVKGFVDGARGEGWWFDSWFPPLERATERAD